MARASWIDPDTLPEYYTKEIEGDDRDFDLVFSDEFNRCGVMMEAMDAYVCLLLYFPCGTYIHTYMCVVCRKDGVSFGWNISLLAITPSAAVLLC